MWRFVRDGRSTENPDAEAENGASLVRLEQKRKWWKGTGAHGVAVRNLPGHAEIQGRSTGGLPCQREK